MYVCMYVCTALCMLPCCVVLFVQALARVLNFVNFINDNYFCDGLKSLLISIGIICYIKAEVLTNEKTMYIHHYCNDLVQINAGQGCPSQKKMLLPRRPVEAAAAPCSEREDCMPTACTFSATLCSSCGSSFSLFVMDCTEYQ